MKKHNMKWAWKTFVLSISLSILFSMISQSLFPKLPAFFSFFVIFFFIFVSVVFDVIGVAVTSAKIADFEKYKGQVGYSSVIKLCNNTEKISSFCGDVVGDICGILSGAGGISLVVNMHIYNVNLYFIVTCLVSSLIAGLTIFGKALMKLYAVEYCEKIVLNVGKFLEVSPIYFVKNCFNKIKKKSNKKDRIGEKDKDKKVTRNNKIKEKK